MDDRKARQLAQQLSLKVIGTVGMLLRAKRFGVIPEIKPLLAALNQVNFRISEALNPEGFTTCWGTLRRSHSI
ncbi:DUF3368 domain-containing protein [Chroococcidiopsis sp. CCMEE 29]|uniref:DUF3368 domain-containing protein n=1 Tax=Chroococcidiopsis sp. CCMEE 29 TaxID=155894 RepID=UPI0020226560|nr:DUF3368 domain-containing protein [Chroococcidiopsis sp. CCMEE 29]